MACDLLCTFLQLGSQIYVSSSSWNKNCFIRILKLWYLLEKNWILFFKVVLDDDVMTR